MVLQNRKQLLFSLLALLCVTLIPFLGATDFHTKGEPRESIVSYSMLETGNWILPSNAGGDMAYKPPFFHWSIAAASLPFGEITEFTSRLPSALATIAMAALFFLFFAKRWDPYKAFLATLIFMTSFEVHRAAMNTRVDGMMTAFIVMAVLQLYKWWEQGMKGVPVWAILFMSMGTLTKGPIGFLLPCASCGLFLLIKGVNFFKAFYKLAFIAVLACVLPVLWYYLAYLQGGEEFLALVKEENIDRFLGKMSYRSHENPVSYNFITMISGYLPWTIPVLLSVFAIDYRNRKQSGKDYWQRMIQWIETVNPARLYALVSAVFIFTFYCIPKSKRSVYLLPVYPFLAVFLTDLFLWMLKKKPTLWVGFGIFLSSVTGLLLLGLALIAFDGVPLDLFLSGEDLHKTQGYVQAMAAAPWTFIALISLLVGIVFLIHFIRVVRRKSYGIPLLAAVFGLFMSFQILLDGLVLPRVLNYKSVKAYAAQVNEIVPEGKVYGLINQDMLRYYIINFYIGNRVHLFDKELPATGHVLIGEQEYEHVFYPRYKDQYDFTRVLRTPHDDTVIGDYIWLYEFKKK